MVQPSDVDGSASAPCYRASLPLDQLAELLAAGVAHWMKPEVRESYRQAIEQMLRRIQDQSDDPREALANVKHLLYDDVNSVNFMHQQRNRAFQMQGMYDGSISAESREEFKKDYELWDALIRERDLWSRVRVSR